MELHELEKLLMQNNKALFLKVKEQPELVEQAAQAEHDYTVALAQSITELRIKGEPATLIGDLARGQVAKFRYNRDVRRGISDACREAIRAYQTKISGIQTLIAAYRASMELR